MKADAVSSSPRVARLKLRPKCKAVGITPGSLETAIRIRHALRLLDVFSPFYAERVDFVLQPL